MQNETSKLVQIIICVQKEEKTSLLPELHRSQAAYHSASCAAPY
jgi:hypothetical protein